MAQRDRVLGQTALARVQQQSRRDGQAAHLCGQRDDDSSRQSQVQAVFLNDDGGANACSGPYGGPKSPSRFRLASCGVFLGQQGGAVLRVGVGEG
jgi:hypothetical protein